MFHPGIDLHKYVSQVEVLDDFGSVVDERSLDHRASEGLRRYFEEMGQECIGFIRYWSEIDRFGEGEAISFIALSKCFSIVHKGIMILYY